MYHQIADVPHDQDPEGFSVSPEQFERQMSYLAERRYQCISLLDAVNQVREKQRPHQKTMVITFDDGYLDFYVNALPVLERLGLTATIFVVAERVGGRSDWPGMRGDSMVNLMSWTQLDEICRAGMTVGSHTLTHARLPQLSHTDACREISDSKLQIEDKLGRQVELFSYPYGASSERLQEVVADCGYRGASGTSTGPWSVYNMWRLGCGRDDTLLAFRIKARGVPYLRWRLRESVPVPLLGLIRNTFMGMRSVGPR